MRVDNPESARRTAIELDVLVLPTPPLPPTKISRCAAVLGCSSVASPAGGGASTVHTGATALRLCCVRPPGAKWKAAPALSRASRPLIIRRRRSVGVLGPKSGQAPRGENTRNSTGKIGGR